MYKKRIEYEFIIKMYDRNGKEEKYSSKTKCTLEEKHLIENEIKKLSSEYSWKECCAFAGKFEITYFNGYKQETLFL